jgi:outer membrane biosynthesis protein TonB
MLLLEKDHRRQIRKDAQAAILAALSLGMDVEHLSSLLTDNADLDIIEAETKTLQTNVGLEQSRIELSQNQTATEQTTPSETPPVQDPTTETSPASESNAAVGDPSQQTSPQAEVIPQDKPQNKPEQKPQDKQEEKTQAKSQDKPGTQKANPKARAAKAKERRRQDIKGKKKQKH